MPDDTGVEERPEVAGWSAFVDGLRAAGEKLAADTETFSETERADGFSALMRALTNQLSRFEVDRERPELVPFNGWRQKFFMDNPDFRYWVADIAPEGRYRVTGSRGDAVYMSLTVYAGTGSVGAAAVSRLDSDSISFDADGRFEIVLASERPPTGDWLALPEGATALWVRQFHDDVNHDRLGWCEVEPLADPPVPSPLVPDRLGHRLERLGKAMSFTPGAFAAAAAAEQETLNEIRHWSEMAGGAVYTEPGIHYLRGGWELGDGEALVIEGDIVPCRYWNVMLYSRFLNSLDYRYRPVSRTGATADVEGDHYRFVLAAEDPGGPYDWLDSEGRPFGIVVFRWLQPEREPTLPTVTRCTLDKLRVSR